MAFIRASPIRKERVV